MATLALQPLALLQTRDGAGSYEKLAASASATFIKGDLLVKINNTLAECGTDPIAITHFTDATETSTVPGDTKLVIGKIRSEDTFEVSAYSATPASAVIADSALDAQNDYGITLATVSGVTAWALDVDKSGAVLARVRLLARDDNSTATDLYPRVRVRFLGSVIQGNT